MKFLKPVFLVLFILQAYQTHAQENEYNLDETYSINKKGTIHLESDDAEVTIRGTDRSDVHLVVYHRVDVDGWEVKSGEGFRMEVENRGGDLYIREADTEGNRMLVGNIQEEYRITIEAPRDVALDIKGDDGTYEISDINLGLKLWADDSEINLNRMNGDNFDFKIDDSIIRMDEGRGTLNLTMDDSEFSVHKGDFSRIDALFEDSKVDIATSLADDGVYLIEMDDGNLKMNITGGGGEFNIRHEDPDITAGNNFEEVSSDEDRSIYRLPGGKALIEIEIDDGEIELQTI